MGSPGLCMVPRSPLFFSLVTKSPPPPINPRGAWVISLPAAPAWFSLIQPSTGYQQGHFWPRMVQLEQSEMEPTSKGPQAEMGLSALLPLSTPSLFTPGLCSPTSQNPGSDNSLCSGAHLQAGSKLGICQARGCETTQLWAKRVELSQKSLHPEGAQNEFLDSFGFFPCLCTFLPPYT